jgi:ABC-type multidrug transport system permease subunit
MGVAIGTFFESTEAASNFIPVPFTFEIVFCGFFVNLDDVPAWISWLEYVFSFKYVWGALMLNEMDTFDEDNCDIPD